MQTAFLLGQPKMFQSILAAIIIRSLSTVHQALVKRIWCTPSAMPSLKDILISRWCAQRAKSSWICSSNPFASGKASCSAIRSATSTYCSSTIFSSWKIKRARKQSFSTPSTNYWTITSKSSSPAIPCRTIWISSKSACVLDSKQVMWQPWKIQIWKRVLPFWKPSLKRKTTRIVISLSTTMPSTTWRYNSTKTSAYYKGLSINSSVPHR